MILFRPVGLLELELVAKADYRAFPPRLEHQPIFYPVLNREYAEEIARGWNPTDEASGFVGFVTRFEITTEIADRYPVQIAGAKRHEELWVPAEELDDFNAGIVGQIVVEAAFPGGNFRGHIDEVTHLPESLAVGADTP